MVGPAHAGFRTRFENEVDPTGILDPAERAVRADRARRAYMLRLAARSADVRRKAPIVTEETSIGAMSEVRDDAAEPTS